MAGQRGTESPDGSDTCFALPITRHTPNSSDCISTHVVRSRTQIWKYEPHMHGANRVVELAGRE